MEIIVAENGGFCFGVDRAMDFTLEAGREEPGKVYTLGPLIHNPQAVARLEEVGVEVADELADIEEGTVVIRSHGVPPTVIAEAEAKGLKVIDATCPFVKTVQQKAKELKESGYQVVISGDKNHPEVKGILGYTEGEAAVVESETDYEDLELTSQMGVVAQTTQSLEKLQQLVDFLLPQVEELRVHNTICTTTDQRQDEAFKLAEKVELMIVVGGYNSANTNRLAEICRSNGVETYHIEQADELKSGWFKNIKKAGITAGASTPNWIIKEVVNRMTEMKEEIDGQESQEQQAEAVKQQEEEEETEAVQQEVESAFSEGDRITGTVTQITEEGVYLDVDAEVEGFIPTNELASRQVEPEEVVGEDEEVEVEVVEPENEAGQAVLSKRKVDEEAAWAEVEEAHENDEIITAEVTREVKGGLVVDIGLRGFIPASHVAIDYIDDLSQFVDEEVELKVIEVERENNNVVLSRRKVLEGRREEKKQEVMNSLEEEEVITGTVTKLVDFGAFVEIEDGVEGLLHISEIAWRRIEHPSEVLEEGQEVEVKVLSVNPEEGRVALGYKQTQPDPWEEFASEYEVGDKVEGAITKTVEFGAFMEIKPGVEGLIHISQLSHDHIAQVEDVVVESDEVEAEIINIDPEERRVGLSIKELETPRRQQKQAESGSSSEQKTEDDKGTTIGDLVGDDLEDLFE